MRAASTPRSSRGPGGIAFALVFAIAVNFLLCRVKFHRSVKLVSTERENRGEAMSTATPAVLVVGAGPVGLVAAAELARHGLSVQIIDKLAQPTDESRAIAVHARSLDMLERMGVVDQLIATGVKSTGMELRSGHNKL